MAIFIRQEDFSLSLATHYIFCCVPFLIAFPIDQHYILLISAARVVVGGFSGILFKTLAY